MCDLGVYIRKNAKFYAHNAKMDFLTYSPRTKEAVTMDYFDISEDDLLLAVD